MDLKKGEIEALYEIESHEMEELGLFFKLSKELSPSMYNDLREPLKTLITDTMAHIGELNLLIDELKKEAA